MSARLSPVFINCGSAEDFSLLEGSIMSLGKCKHVFSEVLDTFIFTV
jgi:hypothetical protein